MAASLHHAQPILSAAINAGFRESGLQSLKNLDDPSSCPMVAVRTSGLSLESLIGVLPEGENDSEIRCIVDEKYLVLLMNIANQRFVMNTERIQRFSENLFQRSKGVEPAWEDDLSRQKRKRAEGLKRKEALQKEIARENIKDSRVPEDHIYSAYD